ncbi:MAG: FAD-dependent oxidoreductase [Gammaproteobacteria bacterium]|nr:FAD-dependent oxidoreductase [Gammaproteobacteria bacterium]
MKQASVLIIGGGIGGLTAAIALRARGFAVCVIEKHPQWQVYGVGIIQQANVIRAMHELGLLDDYLHAGFSFNEVEVAGPDGRLLARVPSPRLVEGRPSIVGISRRALHDILVQRVTQAGATIRLGLTATTLEDDGSGVTVTFSDGTTDRYAIVVGADGLYSQTRTILFPDAPPPAFAGQGVWRYNLPRPADVTCLRSYSGPVTAGLVPISDPLMYMFLTTAAPGNPRYAADEIAAAMRGKLAGGPPFIAALAEQIVDNAGVVYRPLESIFVEGPWHKGNIVLLGDAVHACTPHLGQGAGMAIEDAIVLADELAAASTAQVAFGGYQRRRYPRCQFIVDASLAICNSQLGSGPHVDHGEMTARMFEVVAQPL